MRNLVVFENFDTYHSNQLKFKDSKLLYNWIRLPDRVNHSSPENIQRIESLLKNGIQFKKNDDPDNEVNSITIPVTKLSRFYDYAISLTYHPFFKYGNNSIRVVLNRSKILNKFEGQLFDYLDAEEFEFRVYSTTNEFLTTDMFEQIEVTIDIYDIIKKLDNPNNVKIVLNDNLKHINTKTYKS